jgi:hypothetical protein
MVVASLVSLVLWLAVSSVLANAMHSLATTDFAMRPFGSVSAWLSVSGAVWCCVGALIVVRSDPGPIRRVLISALLVGGWALALLVFSGFADEPLNRLGPLALGLWLLELAGAYWIAAHVMRADHVGGADAKVLIADRVFLSVTALLAAKVLVVWLCPGISIRSIP